MLRKYRFSVIAPITCQPAGSTTQIPSFCGPLSTRSTNPRFLHFRQPTAAHTESTIGWSKTHGMPKQRLRHAHQLHIGSSTGRLVNGTFTERLSLETSLDISTQYPAGNGWHHYFFARASFTNSFCIAIRNHAFQTRIRSLQMLHLRNERCVHATILWSPLLKRSAAHSMRPAQFRYKHTTAASFKIETIWASE